MYLGKCTYLRCHEFWRSAKSACRRAIPHVFLAKTVIGNLDVTIQGKKDIVELQITIDNAVLVEVFKS